jgi:hypothetical protein
VTAVGLRRRVRRLEQARRGHERVRVVEWWPGEPKPAAEPGELLVLVKQYGEPPGSMQPEVGG